MCSCSAGSQNERLAVQGCPFTAFGSTADSWIGSSHEQAHRHHRERQPGDRAGGVQEASVPLELRMVGGSVEHSWCSWPFWGPGL